MTRSGRAADAGSGTVEFVWLAVLLLVPVVYILIAVFDVQRAAYGVSAASKAAARAFLLAPDIAAAHRRAEGAARLALTDQGLEGASISIVCLPRPGDCLTTGSSVRVVVRATQPLPMTPSALGDQIAPITVDSTHIEPYGAYRADRK